MVHILRHMTENQNFLGLGSLWDSEVQNIIFDEKREVERNHRAQSYLRDALLDLAQNCPVSVVAVGLSQRIHVRRIGMMWLDGVLCGSSDRVVVHFTAIHRATAAGACGCRHSPLHLFELVPFGAVLRELERRAAEVVVVHNHGGISGRITGVWRDALSLTTPRGRVVVPWSACGLVLVTDTNRL